ncbi:methyltransferase [Xaviernesmea oryzae]|uniref:Methyltransferase n=1 Tax=Xaviernesmea oryzae TaxID=464029 RepID=A0A1Q9ATA7_9HYPH|nr:class I SAM-dependent methyltransferase [Xaviernesmea oryzae]OLP58672.1 methyltransferase [Xaviernesmea oryzae]SEK67060.1 Methyltransferase domain-containing protein [Xaviernesmea oryzae]
MKREEVAAFWEANAEAWTQLSREGYDIYRDALNTPAFLAMLPPVEGLAGLDVGCGEGSNTRKVAEYGALMQAVDISPTFIRHAQEVEAREPLGIVYQMADAHELPFEDARFDFVTAFMSLMDMPHQDSVLREIARVLKPGGFLQFSILHPCFVPPYRKTLRDAEGRVTGATIAGYFDDSQGQVERWIFSAAPKERQEAFAPFVIPRFHRTLSWWVDAIVGAGLTITKFGEPSASEELAQAFPTVADTRVVGIFLHVQAVNARV